MLDNSDSEATYEGWPNKSTWWVVYCIDNNKELYEFRCKWLAQYGCTVKEVRLLHEHLMWVSPVLISLYRSEYKRFTDEGGRFFPNEVKWDKIVEHWASFASER